MAITSVRRVSELLALSCKEPFLVLHNDKVVLRPQNSFLHKVATASHLNQDIVLPSFCPAPKHPREIAFHSLDVVRVVQVYLLCTSLIHQSDSLLVLPYGAWKGAARSTIAR